MTARHFVLWTSGERTHIASRNAYRRGEARWRHDETNTVPEELVDALGGWSWETPINGPFPWFRADRLPLIVQWLIDNGYTARVVADPESGGGQAPRLASTDPDPWTGHPAQEAVAGTRPRQEPTTRVTHRGLGPTGAAMTSDHPTVLLTAVTLDGEHLVVIPLESAVAELRSYSDLLRASNFGEAREDRGNARLVNDYALVYVERLVGLGLVDEQMDEAERLVEHTWSGAAFDAEDFFDGVDSYWRPEPRRSTSEWLASSEPDLFALFTRPDSSQAADDVPVPVVPAASRDALEGDLLAAGYTVQRVETLHQLYLDPPPDVEHVLVRGGAGVIGDAGGDTLNAPRPAIVLTGLDADGRALLAVPLARAMSDVAAYDTLDNATTLGSARAHPAAAALVADWLEDYLERLRGHGDNESTGADNEPFSAETFFGEDNWWVWRPDARQATVDFLEEQAEELAAELLHDDPQVRLNGLDNPALVPPEARERLERGLRELGLDVRWWEPLDAFYAGAAVDPVTELVGATGSVARASGAGQ